MFVSRSKATIQHLVWTSVIILAFAVTTYADQEKGELLFEHPWEDYDAYVGFLKEFSEQGGFDIIFDPPPASDAWAEAAIAVYLGDNDAYVAALEKALLEGKLVDDNGVHVTDWLHNVSVYRPAENDNYEPDDPLPKVKYCDYVGTGHYTLDRLVTEFHVVNAKEALTGMEVLIRPKMAAFVREEVKELCEWYRGDEYLYTEETGVTRHGSQTYQSDQFRIEQVLLAEGNPEIVRIDIVDYPDNVFYQLQDITTVWFQEGDNYNLVLRVTPIYNGQDLETKEILPKEYIWDLSGERTSGIRVRTARSQFD